MKKRILITGGSNGFLSKHLFNKVLAREDVESVANVSRYTIASIASFDHKEAMKLPLDLNVAADVKAFLQKKPPTHIFHLAGCSSGNLPSSFIIESNIMSIANLLDYAPEGCRFVFASSSVVYGDDAVAWGISYERDKLGGPTTPYAASKLFGENLVNMSTKQGKVKGVNLRMCASVGKGVTHGLVKSLIHDMRKSEEDALMMWGASPGAIQPYLYVEDTINALTLFLDNEAVGTYNVGSDDEISKDQIADIIMEELKLYKNKKWTGKTFPGENQYISMCNKKIRALGWKPQYNRAEEAVRAGVKELI